LLKRLLDRLDQALGVLVGLLAEEIRWY